MSTPSLKLLKGKNKPAPEPEVAEEQIPEPEPEQEEADTPLEAELEEEREDDEVEEVDVDAMTVPQLDALVKEHEIEVPETWWKQVDGVKKMTSDQKKTWLKDNFDEAPEGEEAEEAGEEEEQAPPVEEKAAEPSTKAAQKASKALGAGKKQGTAVATTKGSVHGEIVEPDELSDMIHSIENLKEKDARALVGELSETADLTFFKLGGVLALVQQNGWYKPYASFREYIETEHGMNYRRAVYWVGIYNDLTAASIPWAKVKHLGWTKLKEIASILTEDNVDEWVEIAQKQNTITLQQTVHNAKSSGGTKHVTGDAPTVMTKTFKVHEDQKANIDAALQKAKAAAETEYDTVALEYICIDFVSSGKKGGGAPTAKALKDLGIEKALELVEKAFPDATITVELPE